MLDRGFGSLPRRAFRSGHGVERRRLAGLHALAGLPARGVLEVTDPVLVEDGLHLHAVAVAQFGALPRGQLVVHPLEDHRFTRSQFCEFQDKTQRLAVGTNEALRVSHCRSLRGGHSVALGDRRPRAIVRRRFRCQLSTVMRSDSAFLVTRSVSADAGTVATARSAAATRIVREGNGKFATPRPPHDGPRSKATIPRCTSSYNIRSASDLGMPHASTTASRVDNPSMSDSRNPVR
jgi:hypothetical protein